MCAHSVQRSCVCARALGTQPLQHGRCAKELVVAAPMRIAGIGVVSGHTENLIKLLADLDAARLEVVWVGARNQAVSRRQASAALRIACSNNWTLTAHWVTAPQRWWHIVVHRAPTVCHQRWGAVNLCAVNAGYT